jgi:hypothetical protein
MYSPEAEFFSASQISLASAAARASTGNSSRPATPHAIIDFKWNI